MTTLLPTRHAQDIVRAVGSYLTRRFVCGYPTNGLNKMFALLCREVDLP